MLLKLINSCSGHYYFTDIRFNCWTCLLSYIELFTNYLVERIVALVLSEQYNMLLDNNTVVNEPFIDLYLSFSSNQ